MYRSANCKKADPPEKCAPFGGWLREKLSSLRLIQLLGLGIPRAWAAAGFQPPRPTVPSTR